MFYRVQRNSGSGHIAGWAYFITARRIKLMLCVGTILFIVQLCHIILICIERRKYVNKSWACFTKSNVSPNL